MPLAWNGWHGKEKELLGQNDSSLMVLWCLSLGNRAKEKLKLSKFLKFPRDLPFQNVIPIDQGSIEDITL